MLAAAMLVVVSGLLTIEPSLPDEVIAWRNGDSSINVLSGSLRYLSRFPYKPKFKEVYVVDDSSALLDMLQPRNDLQINQLNFFVRKEHIESLNERMEQVKVPFTVNSGGKALEIFKPEKKQREYPRQFYRALKLCSLTRKEAERIVEFDIEDDSQYKVLMKLLDHPELAIEYILEHPASATVAYMEYAEFVDGFNAAPQSLKSTLLNCKNFPLEVIALTQNQACVPALRKRLKNASTKRQTSLIKACLRACGQFDDENESVLLTEEVDLRPLTAIGVGDERLDRPGPDIGGLVKIIVTGKLDTQGQKLQDVRAFHCDTSEKSCELHSFRVSTSTNRFVLICIIPCSYSGHVDPFSTGHESVAIQAKGFETKWITVYDEMQDVLIRLERNRESPPNKNTDSKRETGSL